MIQESFNDKLNRLRKKLPEVYPAYAEFGKIPPQALNIEEYIIGVFMLDNKAFSQCEIILTPEMFYKDEHKTIFEAIISIYNAGKNIDLLTVQEKLRKENKLDEVGGAYYLSELTNRIGKVVAIEEKAIMVLDRYLLRETIRISNTVQDLAYDDSSDAIGVIEHLENEVITLSDIINGVNNEDNLQSQIAATIESIEKAQRNEHNGVKSCFYDLEKVIFEYERKNFYVLGARPGIGKTAFFIKEILSNKNDLFISLDTNTTQIIKRMLSIETQIPYQKFKTGKLEDYEIRQYLAKLGYIGNSKLKIIDEIISWNELRRKIKNAFLKHKYNRIVIDFIQLIPGKDNSKENRNSELEKISRGCKQLAKELDVPVIAISQLSREVEKRTLKRPQLSDLRDCGSIEQDADVVMFLWRPAVYQFTSDVLPDEMRDVNIETYAELDVAKNRDGNLCRIPLVFKGDTMEFRSQSEYSEPDEKEPSPFDYLDK